MALTPRDKAKQAARVAVSAGLLFACFWMVDFGDLGAAMRGVDPWLFALAFVLNGLGTVAVRAWIAHLVADASGVKLGLGPLLRINFVARFYTLVLPRGAAAAVRWKQYSNGSRPMAASALLLFETVTSIATLFGSAAILLTLDAGETGRLGQALLPISWAGFMLSCVLLLPFVNEGSAQFAGTVVARLFRRSPAAGSLLDRFVLTIANYRHVPRRTLLAVTGASLAGYVLFVLSAWVLIAGMGLELGLVAIAWIRSVTLLLALVPITIAGIGVREGSFIALLGVYGVPPSQALAFSFTTFAIQLLLGLIGALLELARAIRGPAGAAPTTDGSPDPR